jgi:chromosome segregation protein
MEIADALYGVTMHGDGISRVISQRLSGAAAGEGRDQGSGTQDRTTAEAAAG